MIDGKIILGCPYRARRPFHPTRLYAWLEDYFVIQQQEMDKDAEEENEEMNEDEDEVKDEDKSEAQAKERSGSNARSRTWAEKGPAEDNVQMTDSDGDTSNQDQQESRTVLDPADLKRLRQNVQRDLGQVSLLNQLPSADVAC